MTTKDEKLIGAAVAAVAAVQNADREIATGGDSETEDDILDTLRALGDGAGVTYELHCIAQTERQPVGYVDRLDRAQVDLHYIKRKYGGGEYRILAKGAGNRFVKGNNVKFTIAGSTEVPEPPERGGGMAEWLKVQGDREAQAATQRKDMLLALGTIAAPIVAAFVARKDPMENLPALLVAMRPAESPTSMKDMVATMVSLQQLNGGGGDKLDTVLKVLERVKDLPTGEGGGGWVSTLLEVVKDLAPAAKDLVQNALDQRRAAQPVAPGAQPVALPPQGARPIQQQPRIVSPAQVLPASPPAPVSSTSPDPAAAPNGDTSSASSSNPGDDMLLKMVDPWLRKQAQNIEDWAKEDVDPALAADMLMATIPRSFRAFVQPATALEWLNRTDGWQQFVIFHPQIAPYQEWVQELREVLIEIMQDEVKKAGLPVLAPAPESAP